MNNNTASKEEKSSPLVFISYRWSTSVHQSKVQQWAEQLITDGIDVVLVNK